MFPSPIYGASFKLGNVRFKAVGVKFPSPIYGASFKLRVNIKNIRYVCKFPSPIYGASFKHQYRSISLILDKLVSVPYIRG